MTTFEVPSIIASVRSREIEKYKRNNETSRAKEISKHLKKARELANVTQCG